MLPLPVIRFVARLLPGQLSGRTLHRRALAALASGDHAAAERWFEAAVVSYRRELAVEPLARLRVHQLMSCARAAARGEATAMLEIVSRLNRLDRLESLIAPFELVDARSVLAQWFVHSDAELRPLPGFLAPRIQAA